MEARPNFYENAVGAKFSKYINSAGKVVSDSTLPAATEELVRQLVGMPMPDKEDFHFISPEFNSNTAPRWLARRVIAAGRVVFRPGGT